MLLKAKSIFRPKTVVLNLFGKLPFLMYLKTLLPSKLSKNLSKKSIKKLSKNYVKKSVIKICQKIFQKNLSKNLFKKSVKKSFKKYVKKSVQIYEFAKKNSQITLSNSQITPNG